MKLNLKSLVLFFAFTVSNAAFAEGHFMKTVTAVLNNAGGSACSVTSPTGSWIAANGNNGAGDCTWDITAAGFSTAPVCTLTPADNGVGALGAYLKAGTSATSLRTQTVAAGNAVDIGTLYIICIGE